MGRLRSAPGGRSGKSLPKKTSLIFAFAFSDQGMNFRGGDLLETEGNLAPDKGNPLVNRGVADIELGHYLPSDQSGSVFQLIDFLISQRQSPDRFIRSVQGLSQ